MQTISIEEAMQRAARHFEIGEMGQARALCEAVLQIRPDNSGAIHLLGLIAYDCDQLTEALHQMHRSIELDPTVPQYHSNLAQAYHAMGFPEQAMTHWRLAMELRPDYPLAHSNLLQGMLYAAEEPRAICEEHAAWAAKHADRFRPAVPAGNRGAASGRRLRVGYVSPDFRRHSVAFFIEPILAAHDREAFEVTLYSNTFAEDEITLRLRGLAEHWRRIAGLPDDEVARQVRDDGIDILVDLAGHGGQNRLLVFARKPAPIQVTYLGYPATTGLATMDYRLTDALADPPGLTEPYHRERLVRLPGCFLCYRPPDASPAVAPLPCGGGGPITFGSFNTLSKTTPEVITLWARLLCAVPGSRLLLKARGLNDPRTVERIRQEFAGRGVDDGRLLLRSPAATLSEHLAMYGQMDVALDTFPYCGTTTTCESLWMGVPVVTWAGISHVSRVSASLLHILGLERLIAFSPESYVESAESLAADRSKLRALRSGLRERMLQSPLTAALPFTRGLELAYRNMWDE